MGNLSLYTQRSRRGFLKSRELWQNGTRPETVDPAPLTIVATLSADSGDGEITIELQQIDLAPVEVEWTSRTDVGDRGARAKVEVEVWAIDALDHADIQLVFTQ